MNPLPRIGCTAECEEVGSVPLKPPEKPKHRLVVRFVPIPEGPRALDFVSCSLDANPVFCDETKTVVQCINRICRGPWVHSARAWLLDEDCTTRDVAHSRAERTPINIQVTDRIDVAGTFPLRPTAAATTKRALGFRPVCRCRHVSQPSVLMLTRQRGSRARKPTPPASAGGRDLTMSAFPSTSASCFRLMARSQRYAVASR